MARGNSIQAIRTTRAALDTNAAAGNLLTGEPYFITDENRFAVGITVSTYQTYAKQGEAEAALASRLVPAGGSSGQVLARDGSGNAVWTTAASGGTSGPITENQLPEIIGTTGQFANPAVIYIDQYGRVAAALSGSAPSANRGDWEMLAHYETAAFNLPFVQPPFTLMGNPYVVDVEDEPSGRFAAMVLPKLDSYGVSMGTLGFNVNASRSYNAVTITYKLHGDGSQAALSITGGRRITDTTVDGSWKTATVTLTPGARQVVINYQDMASDPANYVLISQITYPADTYAFGDVVRHDGHDWLCLEVSTEDTPGAGTGWSLLSNSGETVGGGSSAPSPLTFYNLGLV